MTFFFQEKKTNIKVFSRKMTQVVTKSEAHVSSESYFQTTHFHYVSLGEQ